MVFVILHLEAVLGKGIEIGDGLVHGEPGSLEALLLQHGLHSRDMAVIDVTVSNDMNKLAHLQAGDPNEKVSYNFVYSCFGI